MNDERFFDLAMKAAARQATDAEGAELEALLASRPQLRSEFERLQADARTAKAALPLMDATQATARPGMRRFAGSGRRFLRWHN